MSEGRPYDPNLLQDLINGSTRGGRAVSHPRVPGPPAYDRSIIHEPDFEHYPSQPEAAVTAIRGLFRVFTLAGRIQRSQERMGRLETRREVIRHVGDTMTDPRGMIDPTNTDPAKKIGWIGIGKTEQTIGRRPNAYKGDFTQMGKWLREKSREITVPNQHRPTIKSERVGYHRLELKRAKIARLHDERRHLAKDYQDALDANGTRRLSPGERNHMAKNSRKIARRDRQIVRTRARFDEIADSRDWRGRVNERRIERARTYPARGTRRRERIIRLRERARDIFPF